MSLRTDDAKALRKRLLRARGMLVQIRQADNDQQNGWDEDLVERLESYGVKEAPAIAVLLGRAHYVRVCIGCSDDEDTPKFDPDCPIHGRTP